MKEKNILVFLVVMIILGLIFYFKNPTPIQYINNDDKSTVCTADAIQCPDGTYVGRSGPNCEFICSQKQ